MPRKPREESPTATYHFINRGVIKRPLFHRQEDFNFYLKLLQEYANKFQIQIFHYCLMTNHTHLLLHAESVSNLSRFGYFVQRRYAHYYGRSYRWLEQVFRKRFISISVQTDTYLLECGRYIERNPLKASLVKNLKDYPYSSYPFYAYGKEDCLITPSPLYETIAEDCEARKITYRFYVSQNRKQELQLGVDI